MTYVYLYDIHSLVMPEPENIIKDCHGFDWDKANTSKSWLKHGIHPFESEEIFFNQPLVIAADVKHSQGELRFFALGITDQGRLLFVCFTIRRHLIRVISSRDMSKKESEVYKIYEKSDS